MDDTSNSNAGLMRRIVHLEQERDELQHDIETLCMQQSGFSGSIEIVSRMQARRAAGFEQELEACKHKLALHAKENLNLQEELAETYQAKGRVAEAFKAAMDKNKELEKEVKFYQSRMAAAFAERDKAAVEVEKLYASEISFQNEIKSLHNRFDQVRAQCSEQEKNFWELQESFNASTLLLDRLEKVVEKFWLLREHASEKISVCENSLEKADILLDEDDAVWTYGFGTYEKFEEAYKTAELALARVEEQLLVIEAASTSLKLQLEEEVVARKRAEEQVALTEETSTSLKLQLEEESLARKEAEERASTLSAHLSLLSHRFKNELQQLQFQHKSLKAEASTALEDERVQFPIITENLLLALEKWKSQSLPQKMGINVQDVCESIVEEDPSRGSDSRFSFQADDYFQETGVSRARGAVYNSVLETVQDDDSRQVLAQALQEKVEVLLLLSQQEERHYLETATKSALEEQVTELRQKLAQVTNEKVHVLVELAEQRIEFQNLQERERDLTLLLEQHRSTNASGRLLPARWSESKSGSVSEDFSIIPALVDKEVIKTKQRATGTGGYLKTLLRGLDISTSGYRSTSGSGIKAGDGSSGVLNSSRSHDPNGGFARLLVENAALQERVASVQHLAQSAHRLRMTLVKVAMGLQGDSPPADIQAAMDVVEMVKAEARRLKVALGCSLPVSYQGPPDDSSGESQVVPLMEGNVESEELQTHGALDSVSVAGIEIAELLITTADLQRAALTCRLELLNTTS